MLLKVLNGFSQAAIITLALVLITTITTKHTSNVALEDFQKQVEERFQTDNKNYDAKIKVVEDSLNRYQQLRENRAQIYGKRLDELYDLYKKNPDPIDKANSTPVQIVADTVAQTVIDKNLSFVENRINKVAEQVDNNNNKLESRVSILEQRVSGLTSQNKNSNVKVVQNNIQTVNNAQK